MSKEMSKAPPSISDAEVPLCKARGASPLIDIRKQLTRTEGVASETIKSQLFLDE